MVKPAYAKKERSDGPSRRDDYTRRDDYRDGDRGRGSSNGDRFRDDRYFLLLMKSLNFQGVTTMTGEEGMIMMTEEEMIVRLSEGITTTEEEIMTIVLLEEITKIAHQEETMTTEEGITMTVAMTGEETMVEAGVALKDQETQNGELLLKGFRVVQIGRI